MKDSLLIISGDLHHYIPRSRFLKVVSKLRKSYRLYTLYSPFSICLRDAYSLGNSDPLYVSDQLSSFPSARELECSYFQKLHSCARHFGSVKCVLDYINSEEYDYIFQQILNLPLDLLLLHTVESVPIGQVSLHDLSLVHHLNSPLDTEDPTIHLFYRLTVFISHLGIAALKNYLSASSGFLASSSTRCIIPDHYSPYLSSENYLSVNHGISSMALTADHVFDNHLKILRPNWFLEQKLSTYRLQQCGAEYASPPHMFEYTREYVNRKILCGQSNQMFSPTRSSSDTIVSKLKEYSRRFSSTIVYYTSSPDEQLNNDFVYPFSQLQSGAISKGIVLYEREEDYLRDVIKFCVLKNIGLIIRIHPRMSPHSDCVIPSGLAEIKSALSEDLNNHCFVVNPGDQISSYWLASLGNLNLFYWSTIGIELMLLGFSSLAPNAVNSYTYYGYPFMHGNHPLDTKQFFVQVENCLIADTPNFLLTEAVRSFSIDCLAVHFVIPDNFYLRGFLIKLYLRRGFLPWLNIRKVPSFEHSIITADSSSNVRLNELIDNCSSLRLPLKMGYWKQSDYELPATNYLNWLVLHAHPLLGIPPAHSARLLNSHLKALGFSES